MGDDAPGRWGPPAEEIEIFATGSTLVRAPHDEPVFEPWQPPAGLDSGPDDERHHAIRGYHARPGHRPGGRVDIGRTASVSERQGRPTDIVRPIFVDPLIAAASLSDGGILDRLPNLLVLDSDDEDSLTWPVAIVDRLHRPIEATLHLRASPSMVVTVLELMPTRRLRVARRRFVARSVASVEELATRIERAARSTGAARATRSDRGALPAPMLGT